MKNISKEHTEQAQACLLRLMNAGYEFPDATAYIISRYVITADELRAFYDDHMNNAKEACKAMDLRKHEQDFIKGRIAAFSNPANDAERGERFRVVELRGDRVLVQALFTGFSAGLEPTAVYPTSDLTVLTNTVDYSALEPLIARMRAEIKADVKAGVVPATVASFSELHDYVDANCYGGGCTDILPDAFDWFIELLNEAQTLTDYWIKAGSLKV